MALSLKVFNNENENEYSHFLNLSGTSPDIYYLPEFLEIDAHLQNGKYEIFTATEGKSVFIYPYIKLNFSGEYKNYIDLTSPYGYCGPLCNDDSFFDRAEDAFLEHSSAKIVTEFVRYHYIYNDKLKFRKNISNLQNRIIVLLDLKQSWEDIWTKSFSGINRNIIRKFEKEKFNFVITSDKKDVEEFINMYYDTMKNANACDFYFFEKDTILKLVENLGRKIILAKIAKDGVTYSSSFFFTCNNIITYYLSARNLLHPKIHSSNFLLSCVARWASENRFEIMNFGGGLTNSKEDSLFKFKANFSKTYSDFFIGKRIHNNKIYHSLIENYIQKNGPEAYEQKKNILQFYR